MCDMMHVTIVDSLDDLCEYNTSTLLREVTLFLETIEQLATLTKTV